jgi:hypothetical protein
MASPRAVFGRLRSPAKAQTHPLKALGMAVLAQAAFDLKSPTRALREAAIEFFESPDLTFWTERASLDEAWLRAAARDAHEPRASYYHRAGVLGKRGITSRVLSFVRASPDEVTAIEVTAALGAERAPVSKALLILVKTEYVRRGTAGGAYLYSATSGAKKPPGYIGGYRVSRAKR